MPAQREDAEELGCQEALVAKAEAFNRALAWERTLQELERAVRQRARARSAS